MNKYFFRQTVRDRKKRYDEELITQKRSTILNSNIF